MRATVLVDNIESGNAKSEWGLAAYIEFNGKVILLDTGASELFIDNAKALDIDLKAVDIAAISHAHFDHSNGLAGFFEINDKAPVYIQENACENCFSKVDHFYKYIGLPLFITDDYRDRFIRVSGKTEVLPNVYVLGHTTSGLDEIGLKSHMFVRKDGSFIPDDYSHEQSLIFDTEKGLVIFNSCCHAGADVVVKEALNAFPESTVYALLGGFHLFEKSDEEVRAFAFRLKNLGVSLICTGHCTGEGAYEILKEELGDSVRQFKSGMVIEI